MIKRYCLKNRKMPISTNAIVTDIEYEQDRTLFFDVQEREKCTTFCYRLGRKDKIYGLGEQVRGINKRGWIYESYCKDDPNHTEDKHGLYGAHNFFIIKGISSYSRSQHFRFGFGCSLCRFDRSNL